jgi:hypothetical protein
MKHSKLGQNLRKLGSKMGLHFKADQTTDDIWPLLLLRAEQLQRESDERATYAPTFNQRQDE